VGGQNRLKKCWTEILAETLAPLLLGIDSLKYVKESTVT
jgi:hypothetical protein